MLYDIQSRERKERLLESAFSQVTFAQFGEDIMMLAFLESAGVHRDGFYVDVGAHHPYKMSNTAILHDFLGWRGINIEANPEGIAEFNRWRPRDINIHSAVSDREEEVEFHIFNHSAVSSADITMIERQSSHSYMTITKTLKLRTKTLKSILDEHLPAGQIITLLSVDVEGFDLRCLQSNQWSSHSPMFILVEDHEFSFDQAPFSRTHDYLQQYGYRLISRCVVSSLYRLG